VAAGWLASCCPAAVEQLLAQSGNFAGRMGKNGLFIWPSFWQAKIEAFMV